MEICTNRFNSLRPAVNHVHPESLAESSVRTISNESSTSSPLSAQELDLDALSGLEAVADAELRRDDALGRIVSRAFSLPAGPVPRFIEGGGDS